MDRTVADIEVLSAIGATFVALMGLDHEALTYNYAGRDFRLTDVKGSVASQIFA